IELVECETLADPAMGTDCANRMVEEDVVAVVVGSSSVGESIWEPLHQAGIPLMFANTTASGALTDSESTFNLTDPFFAQVDLQVQQAKDAGVSKVTAVVIDVPTAMSLYSEILPELYSEQGIDLEVVPIAPGTADMTPQMQPIADGDPTTVSIVGSDAFCI
nr:ABC transporter substrate-binding protein [Micromonospora sp. DSM 115978]